MAVIEMLNGCKTYLAAGGLVVLGVFQLSTGQIPLGLHSLFSALAMAGLRAAIGNSKS